MGKGWARRTVHVHGVTPSGDAVLEAVDDVGRELFAAGEQGALKRSSTPLHYPLGERKDTGRGVGFAFSLCGVLRVVC